MANVNPCFQSNGRQKKQLRFSHIDAMNQVWNPILNHIYLEPDGFPSIEILKVGYHLDVEADLGWFTKHPSIQKTSNNFRVPGWIFRSKIRIDLKWFDVRSFFVDN